MSKKTNLLIFVLLISQSAFAEFTLHILNPWRTDTIATRRDTLRMGGNNEVGYYPGSNMTSEGDGWFYYTYKVLDKHGVSMNLTSWIGNDTWNGRVEYHFSLITDSLFAPFPQSTNELWIYISDTAKPPQVYDIPPNSKVINIFNPWPDNSPRMIVGNNPPLRMRPLENLCGWYRYYFVGSLDNLSNVRFTDYFQTQTYSASGMTDGVAINLRSFATTQDTIYILPRPFPYGAPSISATFPGRTGECGTRKVSGLFRDWKLDNISFFNNPTGMSGSGTVGMVLPKLSLPDYKPKRNTAGNTKNADSLESWYKTVTFPDGTTNDTCIDLVLRKGEDGLWEFDSDWLGGFFVLDNFNNPNNIKYEDAYKVMHNFHFTMEMHLQFIYHEGAGLAFYFRGDDDVWIYVNDILAIDLGGLHDRAADTLLLDKQRDNLGLVDGQIYTMDMFYAERNPVGANFRIKTSMDLVNSDELYYKETKIGDGNYQYNIWQRIVTENSDCGTTRLLDEEEPAQVDFFLEGPQFADDSIVPLIPGTHFGGITIDPGKSRVTIDSTHISGLAPGEYRVTFKSTVNSDRNGYLVFNVAPHPDHLDILTDSLVLNQKTDAVIDSIVIPVEKDSVKLYSVIRDSSGNYIQIANAGTWISRNTEIATVKSSQTDPSRCIVTKGKSGSTWIVVNQDGLKPDSVLVITHAKPDWPIINSAVMLDDNGDLIPDLLHITLSDTFKTDQSLSSVTISYKGQTYQIVSDKCRIVGTSLHVPFQSLTGIDGTPSGKATIEVIAEGKKESHTNSFSDGVGPALIDAAVLENDGSEPDVLFLTLSEKIFPATIKGNQLLLIKDGTTDTLPCSINSINNIAGDSIIIVTLNPSVVKPLAGDKIRLVPGSIGGSVTDINQNTPHTLNPAVILKFRSGAASIDSAQYMDTDANGMLDRIIVHFYRSIELSEFNSLQVTWNSEDFDVDIHTFTKINDSTISFPIDKFTGGKKPATSGAMNIAINYKSVPGIIRTAAVTDHAASVLVSAQLSPGELFRNGSKAQDTLTVVFSENAKYTGQYPFQFFQGSQPYRLKLLNKSDKSSKYTYLVEAIEPVTIIPAEGDTVRIDIAASVCDTFGNVQSNPLNNPVLLDVIEPPAQWVAQIGPNPITGTSFAVVKVLPRFAIDVSRYTAQIMILDAVGNKVHEVPMLNHPGALEYIWNGRNHFGRLVGSGTYALFIVLKENGIEKWKTHINVGVRR